MRYDNRELTDRLAAEYVLGTLGGLARSRFEKLLLAHPGLRQQVQDWEIKLNRWVGDASEVVPPAENWTAIQERLFPTPAQPSWWERLSLWRNLALGSSLLSVVLLVMVLIGAPPADNGYIAMISNDQQETLWMVKSSDNLAQFVVRNLQTIDLPPGKRCFLWLKPAAQNDYQSVGMLPEFKGETLTLTFPEGASMAMQDLLVSVEDATGTPPVAPTNPERFQVRWMPVAI